MKTSKKLMLFTVAFLSISLVIIVASITLKYKKDITIQSNLLEKQNDSLNIIIYQRDLTINHKDSIIEKMYNRQYYTDSLININNKSLKNEKIKVKNLNYIDRVNYIDSILKSAGIRK